MPNIPLYNEMQQNEARFQTLLAEMTSFLQQREPAVPNNVIASHEAVEAVLTPQQTASLGLRQSPADLFASGAADTRVFIRCRPILPHIDGSNQQRTLFSLPQHRDCLFLAPKIDLSGKLSLEPTLIPVDATIGPEGDNEALYHASCAPLVEMALRGASGSCLAYGQTGSGKSHSVAGLLTGVATRLDSILKESVVFTAEEQRKEYEAQKQKEDAAAAAAAAKPAASVGAAGPIIKNNAMLLREQVAREKREKIAAAQLPPPPSSSQQSQQHLTGAARLSSLAQPKKKTPVAGAAPGGAGAGAGAVKPSLRPRSVTPSSSKGNNNHPGGVPVVRAAQQQQQQAGAAVRLSNAGGGRATTTDSAFAEEIMIPASDDDDTNTTTNCSRSNSPSTTTAAAGAIPTTFQDKRVPVYSIAVTLIEISAGGCRDLLVANSVPGGVQVVEAIDGSLQLLGAVAATIRDGSNFLAVIEKAKSARATSATARNAGSSRSHMIARITISRCDAPRGAQPGVLCLADLAGSESTADAAQHDSKLVESTKFINSSLLTLKECVRARASAAISSADGKHVHIPYRRSPLTLLLRDSFEIAVKRPTKTVIIACVSPLLLDSRHSHNTLKYAQLLFCNPVTAAVVAVDETDPHNWTRERTLEWLAQAVSSGNGDKGPAIAAAILPGNGDGKSLVMMSECELVKAVVDHAGYGEKRAGIVYQKLWQLVIDARSKNRKTADVAKKQALMAAAANIAPAGAAGAGAGGSFAAGGTAARVKAAAGADLARQMERGY